MSEIALKAGMSPSTALRIAKGKTREGWPSTNAKLVAALEAEEERMRKHLADLPRPEKGEAA
ncbi:hypothetical protein IVB40_07500 [Bradyrhizobium sp. 40]|uniref:hypothetical protein n=1 Tax=Bradyrhizobium sp. 40 TaxID=2782674 RepID=UPI001FFFD933|nr:hypothetical protein [Bradyrhizobium sp. 40]UPJ43905.1 hypothetical protein IVB40_07500 [Bradyrhizobium sp. 40]